MHHYLWGVAVDPGDPDTIITSASIGPLQAHRSGAVSFIYRRAAGKPWHMVSEGLPEPRGMKVNVLATNKVSPAKDGFRRVNGTLSCTAKRCVTTTRLSEQAALPAHSERLRPYAPALA